MSCDAQGSAPGALQIPSLAFALSLDRPSLCQGQQYVIANYCILLIVSEVLGYSLPLRELASREVFQDVQCCSVQDRRGQ